VAGFDKEEIHEIHGSTEIWQCSQVCKDEVWEAPKEFEFTIQMETMEAPEQPFIYKGEEEGGGGHGTWESKLNQVDEVFKLKNGFISNHPRCKNCGAAARPAILMFGDQDWVRSSEQSSQCSQWETIVENMVEENPNLNVVILEIGCGLNVPTVRFHCENMLESLGTNCTLIRINPDYPFCNPGKGTIISIMAKGLESLLQIESSIGPFRKVRVQKLKPLPKLPEDEEEIKKEEVVQDEKERIKSLEAEVMELKRRLAEKESKNE